MDWFEYAVTTRSGPGPVERPEGDGWELVDATSTAPDGRQALRGAEHHAWWKRKRRQEHAPLGQGRPPPAPEVGRGR